MIQNVEVDYASSTIRVRKDDNTILVIQIPDSQEKEKDDDDRYPIHPNCRCRPYPEYLGRHPLGAKARKKPIYDILLI